MTQPLSAASPQTSAEMMKLIRTFNGQPVKIPHFKTLLTRKQARWPHFFNCIFIMFISWMFITSSFKKCLIVEQFRGNYLHLMPVMVCLILVNTGFIQCNISSLLLIKSYGRGKYCSIQQLPSLCTSSTEDDTRFCQNMFCKLKCFVGLMD